MLTHSFVGLTLTYHKEVEMGDTMNRVAENLKKGISPTTETRNDVERVQVRVHNFDGARAMNMANLTSQAGNRTAFWAVQKDGERFFRITTVFADGTKIYKDLSPSDLHRLLINQTRRTKGG